MKLGRALEVVRYQRQKLGRNRTHCGEPVCTICALFALDDELIRMREAGAPKLKSRGTCLCGRVLVDGICGVCNG